MNYRDSKIRCSKGFTLIEVLTVIAIIAILSAILVPTISQMQSTARKTRDVTNMRQIINASQLFATMNGDLLPQLGHRVSNGQLNFDPTGPAVPSIGEVAAVLALEADLNDLNIWISQSDTKAMQLNGPTPVLVNGEMNSDLTDTNPLDDADPENPTSSGFLSYHYVVGLTLSTPNQTPLIFSRLSNSGSSGWGPTDMYTGEGGHIGFAGGAVNWFETQGAAQPFAQLFQPNGTPATTMNSALPTGAQIAENSSL